MFPHTRLTQIPRERPVGKGGQRLGTDPLPPVHTGPAEDPRRRPQRHQPGAPLDRPRLRHDLLPKAVVAELRGAGATVAAGGGEGGALPVGRARGVGLRGGGGRGTASQGRRRRQPIHPLM